MLPSLWRSAGHGAKSDGLNEIAILKHANNPAAPIVEQVKGFAGTCRFDCDSQRCLSASLAGFIVAVDGGAVPDLLKADHGWRCGGGVAPVEPTIQPNGQAPLSFPPSLHFFTLPLASGAAIAMD